MSDVCLPVAAWHRVAHGERVGHLKVVAEALVDEELGALEGHRGDSLRKSVEFLDRAGVQGRDRGLRRLRWRSSPAVRRRRRLLGTWQDA